MRNTLLLASYCAMFTALGGEKPTKNYSEHGTVVAVHESERTGSIPPYTDPYGKIRGGITTHHRLHIYRVETNTLLYELSEGSKRHSLSLDQQIQFRVDQDSAYVLLGSKETKFPIVGTERKR